MKWRRKWTNKPKCFSKFIISAKLRDTCCRVVVCVLSWICFITDLISNVGNVWAYVGLFQLFVVNSNLHVIQSIYLYNGACPGIFDNSNLYNETHTHCTALGVITKYTSYGLYIACRILYEQPQCSCVNRLITLAFLEFPHNDNRL